MNQVKIVFFDINSYDYAVSKGWGEVARICLTHSFPIKDIEADIGKKRRIQ